MKKNVKKFFSKKNIILFSTATSILATPIAVSISYYGINNGLNTSNYSAIDYIKNNSSVSYGRIENEGTTWSIKYDGVTKHVSEPKLIMDFVNKLLVNNEQIWSSTIDNLKPYTNIMGDLNLEKIYDTDKSFNKVKKDSPDLPTKDIFKGNNDKAYDNEINAKESFKQVGYVYYFNDIYFSSKEDLKQYLLNQYLPLNKTKYNTITLVGPNGNTSAPINITSKNATKEIERFVKNNSFKVLKYKNSITNESYIIDKNTIESNLANVNINRKDLNYLHVQSNQGENRYIIDNCDNANLIGPYFYKGNLDVGAFQNKNMWRKTNNISKHAYVESKIDTLIGSFFSSVLNDDKSLLLRQSNDESKIPLLFRTLITKVNKNAIFDEKTNTFVDETISLDEWFLAELKRLSPVLFNEVVKANLNLMQGNKYNTFYKIPTLYNFLLQRIVTWGLGQQILDLVNYYFTEVTGFVQDVLELVFDNKSFFEKKVAGKVVRFNATEFFQIGNPEYDINTSVEYFMNEIKTYKALVGAMWAYNSAFTNIFLTGGMIPFDSNDHSYLIENNLLTEQEFRVYASGFKKVYDIYSETDYASMLDTLIVRSGNPKIVAISQMNKSQWVSEFEKLSTEITGTPYSVIIKGIGLKNTEYHSLARAYLNDEIRLFNETGRIFNGGYLDELYSSNPSKDSLSNYIIYMNKNPKEDSYRVYLSFMFAHKLNLSDFKNDNTYTDPSAFWWAVARMVTYAFGTVALTGTTISSIYNGPKAPVRTDNHPISQMLELNNNPGVSEVSLASARRSINTRGKKEYNTKQTLFSLDKWTKKIKSKVLEMIGHFKPSLPSSDNDLIWFGDSPIKRNKKGNNKPWDGWLLPPLATENEPNKPNKPNKPGNGGSNNGSPNIPSEGGAAGGFDWIEDNDIKWEVGSLNSSVSTSIDGGSISMEMDSKWFDVPNDGNKPTRPGNKLINLNDPFTELNQIAYNEFVELDKLNKLSMDDYYEIGSDGIKRPRQWYVECLKKEYNIDITLDTSYPGAAPNPPIFDEIMNGNVDNGPPGSHTPHPTPTPEINGNNGHQGTQTPSPSPTPGSNGDNASNSRFETTNRIDYDNLSVDSNNESKNWWTKTDENISDSKKEKIKKMKKQKAIADWSGRSTMIKFKNGFTKVANVVGDYILPAVGSAIMVLEIVSLLVDLFNVTEIKDFYVYTTADGTEFIWDGGLTVSKYLGFDVKQVIGIESMNLLTPLQITLPQLEEFYYFDKIKYYDPNSIVKASLKYMLEKGLSTYNNSNFSIRYSLVNYSSIYDTAGSINELLDNVYKSLNIIQNTDGSLNVDNLNKNSIYLSKSSYAFDGGLIASDASHQKAIADNLVENIRRTTIIQLPKKYENNESYENKPFELSGKIYRNGKIEEVLNNNEYIIDNSANLLKQNSQPTPGNYNASHYQISNIYESEANSLKLATELFYSKILVGKKNGLESQYNQNVKFSEIKSSEIRHKIYAVQPNSINLSNTNLQNTLYFANLEDAQRYILKEIKFTKHATYTTIPIYNFKGKLIYGDEKLEQFAKKYF